MEEEKNEILSSIISRANDFLQENQINLSESSREKISQISNRIEQKMRQFQPTLGIADLQKYTLTKQGKFIISQLSGPNEEEQRPNYSYFPLHWGVLSEETRFLIYGGIVVNFSCKSKKMLQNQPMFRTSQIEYFKEKGMAVLHYDDQRPTLKEFDFLVKRAQSMCDEQYYILSLSLIEFRKQIDEFIQITLEKQCLIKSEQEMSAFEKSYITFQQWVISEVMKLDSSRLFTFQIHGFNIRSCEFEMKKTGCSTGFMALIGVDLDNPFNPLQKDQNEFLDGESNLNMLINALQRLPQGKQPLNLKISLMTLDKIRIQADQEIMQFTNRDKEYPFNGETPFEIQFKYEFMVKIVFYDVSAEQLNLLIHSRQMRNSIDNQSFDDFTNSIESQLFLERFYSKQKNQPKSFDQTTQFTLSHDSSFI